MMEQAYPTRRRPRPEVLSAEKRIGVTIKSGMIPQSLIDLPAATSHEPRLRSVELRGPAGRLEAVLNEGSPDAKFAAVVCHPHPQGGGTLHNKVVYHAMKALNAPQWGLGWPVLRFNFRGTGRSEGEHHGSAESADVSAALDWLQREFQRPVVVAGFSFGAAMALKSASLNASDQVRHNVRAIAALGLPTHADGHIYSYSFLQDLKIPKLFLSGDQDPFAPRAELEQVTAHAADPKDLVFIPGADHFFAGRLEQMQNALTRWLKEHAL